MTRAEIEALRNSHPSPAAVEALALAALDYLDKWEGAAAACAKLHDYAKHYPTVAGENMRLQEQLSAARRAANAERERIASELRKEAQACLGDIVEGDEQGRREANARAGALLTAADDTVALPPPFPEEGESP